MVGSVRPSVIKAPPPNMNVMESNCGGWTRGSAGGGFLFNPEFNPLNPEFNPRTPAAGFGRADASEHPICPAPVPRLASDPSLAAAPGHGNAPRLSNYSKAAGHRVKYRS